MKERRAWLPAAAVLAFVYAATLAPSVTFWDAGEFIAAAYSLGIPHPPGTPLYVLLLNVWGKPWPVAWYAAATNLFSALATTAAAALSAAMVFRWLRAHLSETAAFASATAAAICAGAMFTAWSSATETEVYAVSLALSIATLAAAERRRPLLVAYCFGLAAALHVSALVASPAAIMLAASEDDRFDLRRASALAGAALAAMAIGTWNGAIAIGAVIAIVAAWCHPEPLASLGVNSAKAWRQVAELALRNAATNGLRMTILVILGASPLLFMVVRAQFDPAINQGNPDTLAALTDVIGRRQYELPGLWPRRAPIWIQLGNWFEYADWQTALSLGPSVVPTVQRTLVSIAFGALGLFGAMAHRRADPRSWRAVVALFLAGTLGVALYLNLRASPSFGWGVLPETALREARERDYFFVLGFWAAGLWIGIGAVALTIRRGWPLLAGVVLASLPIALNWSAVSRRTEPDASLPTRVARALVEGLPERTVLFVAGDNDTYPVWYARTVLKARPDITLVTVPLIGAGWYVSELIRRNPDLAGARTVDGANVSTIAEAARSAGRPIAAAITLEKGDRIRLNGCWRVIGAVLIDDPSAANCLFENQENATAFPVDTLAVRRWVDALEADSVFRPKSSVDPIAEYFARVLDCPRRALMNGSKSAAGFSLDSLCNL